MNGLDELINALSNLAVGATKDSGVGAIMPFIMAFARGGMQSAAHSLIGSMIDARDRSGNKIELRHLSSGNNAVEGSYYAHLREISGAGGYMRDILKQDREKAIVAYYRGLGYTEEQAKKAVGTTEGKVADFIYNMLDKGATEQAYNTVNSAMARRFAVMQFNGAATEEERIKLRQDYTKAIIGRVREDFYKGRGFGSLELGDVAQLADRIIGTGAYDNVDKNVKASTDRFSKELKSYAKAFDSLRSVFNGDMKTVLASMDAMMGGSALALSPASLQHTTKMYQHASLTTGVSDKRLLTLARTMYTQGVAQGGGDERFAANAAVLNSYILSSKTITTPGVSQVDLERLTAHIAGAEAASGKSREMAAAYAAYRANNKAEDNDKTWKAFQSALRASGKPVSDFGSAQYIASGGTAQGYREFGASRYVENMASDMRFQESLRRSSIRAALSDYDNVLDNFQKSLGYSDKEMADKFGANWRRDGLQKLKDRANTLGRSDVINKLEDYFSAFTHQNNLDALGQNVAEELMTRGDAALRSMDAKLGKTTDASRLSKNPLQAVQQVLERNKGNVNAAQLLAAYFYQQEIDANSKIVTVGGKGGKPGDKKPDDKKPGESGGTAPAKDTGENLALIVALLIAISAGISQLAGNGNGNGA